MHVTCKKSECTLSALFLRSTVLKLNIMVDSFPFTRQ